MGGWMSQLSVMKRAHSLPHVIDLHSSDSQSASDAIPIANQLVALLSKQGMRFKTDIPLFELVGMDKFLTCLRLAHIDIQDNTGPTRSCLMGDQCKSHNSADSVATGMGSIAINEYDSMPICDPCMDRIPRLPLSTSLVHLDALLLSGIRSYLILRAIAILHQEYPAACRRGLGIHYFYHKVFKKVYADENDMADDPGLLDILSHILHTMNCPGAISLLRLPRPAALDVDNENHVCVICTEDVYSANSCTTACGHRYHTTCLVRWSMAKRNNSDKCPNCRASLVDPISIEISEGEEEEDQYASNMSDISELCVVTPFLYFL